MGTRLNGLSHDRFAKEESLMVVTAEALPIARKTGK
jgi:hypothetical protein